MNRTKQDQAAGVKQMIVGTLKHYPDGTQTIPVGGATVTVTALTQLMQNFVDQRAAVEASKAATKAKVDTERSQAPSQLAVIRAFETVVRAAFGTSADTLADFGLVPPKVRAPITAEQKAVAVARRTATRAARHTMGKNQKKNVKGAVTATLVVTPSTGSPPVAPPTAAPPTGNAPAVVATGNATSGNTPTVANPVATPHAS